MNLVEYAKKELELMGYTPLDTEQEEGPNKWIQKNIIELLEVFSNQGHSGTSANYCLSLFNKLARFEPLSPLTLKEDEWSEVSDNIFQNKRDTRVFKNGVDGKAYFIEAFIKRTPDGNHWQGNLKMRDGRTLSNCYIKDTSMMPTIYLNVTEEEVSPGNFEMYPKDHSQLDELEVYYQLEWTN